MAEAGDESVVGEDLAATPPRRRRRWPLVLLAIVALGLIGTWLVRKQIADRIVSGQLESMGLPATYQIDTIAPNRQVLRNVVVGDPARPDLTIEEVVMQIEPTLGVPTIGAIKLVRPRLYGEVKDGRVSFGSLDKVIYAQSEETFRLPDLDLAIVDGRGRIGSLAGPVGVKVDGTGNLRNGFAGTVAAVAPTLSAQGCKASQASLFGRVTIASEQPKFSGPLRLGRLDCPNRGLSLHQAALQFEATSPATLDAASGKFALQSGALAWQDNRAGTTGGSGDFTYRNGDLTSSYKLGAARVSLVGIDAQDLQAQGMLRTRDRFTAIETEGSLAGTGVAIGAGAAETLAGLARAGDGTLLAPLATQLRTALLREAANSRLAADYTLRQTGALTNLVVPRATLTGQSDAELVGLSRVQLTSGGASSPLLSGNVVTGGPGIPRIEGRFERQGNGSILARLTMAEYRAGEARVSVPQLALVQSRGGEIGFAGQALVSGPLPGGRIDGLVLPIEGNWSARQGVAAWRRCMPVHFQRFVVGSLALDGQTMTLCPGREGAIVRSGSRGTRISAGTAALALSGRLGSTDVRIHSGPIGLAWPGALDARQIDVALAGKGEPTTLKFASITGQLGKVMAGRFSGAEVKLNNVPLDVFDAAAAWRFADGTLSVSEGTLRVEDRQVDDRFRPLIARDATLSLHGSDFTAKALLREPKSDRDVVLATIIHDMDDGRGHALLDVPGLVFDRRMQPDTLTPLALGVIANAKGTVAGNGRIDWNPADVTSTGRFATDRLDFAAAFGPVKGVSGRVEFTDLLGIVTAPDQRLEIASINPGIEVEDGTMSFELQGNNVLLVNGARWPFMDGTLELQPSRMVLGAAEVRRYTLAVEGLNAAKFVERLELSNISASGHFDGVLPLVFDEQGGHIEGGLLTSRSPGGNVSYVGELTYKDLGTMANFAFQALRSLDYRQMRIAMDGNLEGDIVTRVRLDGVTQGTGAKRNFITRRFAKLPIQFNINVRAPFQRLVTTFKSIYDPTYVRDPRELGIVDGNGKPVRQESKPPPGEPDIQAPDSRNKP